MDNYNKKCTYKEHNEINAICYCLICKVYMCNKCENFHSNLLKDHRVIKSDKDINEVFTGYCKEKNHLNRLDYYCKGHNTLCCAACISKIKNKSDGKHKDCEIYIVEDIKKEKINKLNENIKYLENLSDSLKESINNLKNICEKINEDKEELKLNIQKIFTKLRNKLNDREDKLLLEVDKIFDETFFNEEIIKRSEKLPNQIKISLENSKEIDKKYNNDENNLNFFINECINIENNIKDINNINQNIEKYNNFNNIKIKFYPEEENYELIRNIEVFGQLLKNEIFQSLILDKTEDKLFIMDAIKKKIKKDNVDFSLIFRMSENGTKAEDFHKYCDNKGPSLVIIKTKTDRIFGGFTPLDWTKKGELSYDEPFQTFIFSINLKKIFNIKDNESGTIKCDGNYGPVFGNWDFGLNKDMKVGETYATNKSSFLSNDNLELTGGNANNEKFETVELEVYKAKY